MIEARTPATPGIRNRRGFVRFGRVCAELALALCVAAPVIAQQQPHVARLVQAQGNVLVSQGDALVAGRDGELLANGTRILTTAHSSAVIRYDGDCEIRLGANERYTIRQGGCPALAGEITSLGPAPGAIGGGTGGVATGGAIGGTGTLLANVGGAIAALGPVGIVIYDNFRKNPVSPN